jgi:hypothetical protein
MPKEEEIHSHIAINYLNEYYGTTFNSSLNMEITFERILNKQECMLVMPV